MAKVFSGKGVEVVRHDFGATSPRAVVGPHLGKMAIFLNITTPDDVVESVVRHEMRHVKDGILEYFPSDLNKLRRMGRRKFIQYQLDREYRAYAAQAKALKNYSGSDQFIIKLRDYYRYLPKKAFRRWIKTYVRIGNQTQSEYFGSEYDRIIRCLRDLNNG